MNSTWTLRARIADSSHDEGILEREAAMDEMARKVTGLNIERFQKKLAEEAGEEMRQRLFRLLAEEEAKFVALMIPSEAQRQRREPRNMDADRAADAARPR